MSLSIPLCRLAALTLLVLCLCGCRDEKTASVEPEPTGPWFVDVTAEVGVDFVHETGSKGQLWMPEITGGGLAMFDADGDDDLDLYFTTGNDSLPAGGDRPGPVNRFYRNEDGHFVDATLESGLGDRGFGNGVATCDVDNDGDVDVYLSNFGPDKLYLNDGKGHFTDGTKAAGIDVAGWSTSVGCLDFDNDGDLDIYVSQYDYLDPEVVCYDPRGGRNYCGPLSLPAVSDVLLRNEGNGTFLDVSGLAGLDELQASALGVAFNDVDEDGLMDVYVANDGHANHLWMNQGDGTFRNEAMAQGVALNSVGIAEAGMGVLWADLDGDSHFDIFLTHLRAESNTYYRSRGPDRGFSDQSGRSGLGEPSMAFTGFGAAAIDIDLDGDLDVAVANGRVQRLEREPRAVHLSEEWQRVAEPNAIYLNDGAGAFSPSLEAAGDFGRFFEVSRGLAAGDIDGDGDLDLVVSNLQDAARVYRNDAPRAGHWLMVRAREPLLKRDALNARIDVDCGGRRRSRLLSSTQSYLTANEPIAHFGLGDCTEVETVEVRWPDGERERFPGGSVDRQLILERGSGTRIR